MDLLIVGGTRFVGRHIAEQALARGHRVTLLHRGSTQAPTLGAAEHLLADRDRLGGVLEGRSFDATIDACAYWPGQVRSLASALDGRGGHYVYISSASAYAETSTRGGDESLPLARIGTDDPDSLAMGPDTYGPLKALCEKASTEEFGAVTSTIVRPTYVVGPHDHTGRFTWWVDRISRGGAVACPGPADHPMQLIDARDQASWVVGLAERRVSGAFHSCSPSRRGHSATCWRASGRRSTRMPSCAGSTPTTWAPRPSPYGHPRPRACWRCHPRPPGPPGCRPVPSRRR